MSRSKQPSIELSSLQPAKSKPADETNPYGDRAYVLAATDETSIFESTPTVVLCPNCGDVIATHDRAFHRLSRNSIPAVTPVKSNSDAGVQSPSTQPTVSWSNHRRWCAVAVDAAYSELVEPPTLTAMTQAYWNEWLWAGITCPLCRRGINQLTQEIRDVCDSLDYYHWSTSPDQGITLCRECHDIIGFDSYDNQVEERAHEWGFRSRNDLQIIRLAL